MIKALFCLVIFILSCCSASREVKKETRIDWSKKVERSSMLVLHLEYYKADENKSLEKTIPEKFIVSNMTLSNCSSGGFIYRDYLIIPNILKGVYKIKSIALPDSKGSSLTLSFTDDTLKDSNTEIRKYHQDWSNKTILYKSVVCDIQVKKPGIYYLGSYKIEGRFQKDQDFNFIINRQKNEQNDILEFKDFINNSRSGWQKSSFTNVDAFYFPSIRLF